MANIDRIVNVSISLNTTGITQEGFSTMMVVGPHNNSLEKVISVHSVDELAELGFKADDPIYVAVGDALSQTPRLTQVKIGKFQCDTVRVGVRKDVVVGSTYKLAINYIDANNELASVEHSVVVEEGQDKDFVLTVLADMISSAEAIVDSEGNNIKFTASVEEDEIVVSCSDSEFNFVVEPNSLMEIKSCEMADISIAENMAMITSVDNDFYGIILTSRKPEDILAMADWTESHTKLFGTAIAENGCLLGDVNSDTGSKLQLNNYFRTYWFYHKEADKDYPDAAVMARCFAIMPGGETWANKKLAGVTTDNITNAQYEVITKKGGNTFEKFRNVTITQNGKVAAGEWIDVIRFRDWLVEEIKTEEFAMLINRDKLPYTDAGIALVENVLNAVLQLGQRRGGIAPTEYDEDNNPNYGFVVTVPKASSISANVKATRKLQDVKFVARLAGAIHVIDITGSLTYEALMY